jgi:alpha-galactosidase
VHRNFRIAFLFVSGCWVLANTFPAAAQSLSSQSAPVLAETPPMGWNSWDAYGATVTEAQFKANAAWMAQHLKPFGWQYVVLDMEWFVTNPVAQGNSKQFAYSLDDQGRYTPAVNRFPSAANNSGFKPIADYVHSLGLKFGIHILRGIPKRAVEQNLPIEASPYHAADAASLSDLCPWNYDNYGVDAAKPGAQAYYDSIAHLYASWDVDLVKVDCISSRPYKGDDIRMLSTALRNSGRPIVLSLSPGAAPLEKENEMRKYAQMWRISDDIWDLWHSTVAYPQGLVEQFANAAKWAPFSQPGGWPDADMLPLGHLGPAPGWGEVRDTRLTHDEQRSLLTLWSIFRSPLMIGGDLPLNDGWTSSLLTNPEVIAVDQHSRGSHALIATDKTVVWIAQAESGNDYYLAIFNVSPETQKIHYPWRELGLEQEPHAVRDLWERRDLKTATSIEVTLSSHQCVLYRIAAQ